MEEEVEVEILEVVVDMEEDSFVLCSKKSKKIPTLDSTQIFQCF